MSVYKYKTNLKCQGCISRLCTFLREIPEVESWEVDLDSDEKTLTVKSARDVGEEVIKAGEKAGYRIEKLIYP
jgi:copper chaperone